MKQMKNMRAMSGNKLPPLTAETTVQISVPCVNRRKVNTNIMLVIGCYIIHITDDRFYNIETKN